MLLLKMCGRLIFPYTFIQESVNPYEAERINHVYMAFHYTPVEEYLAHQSGPKTALGFPQRCAQLCIKHRQVQCIENVENIDQIFLQHGP